MAEYRAVTRTNYFRVEDEKKFKEIVSEMYTYDGQKVICWTENIDGELYHAFGCDTQILGIPVYDEESGAELREYDIDAMECALKEVVDPRDAIIVTELGHIKLRSLVGISLIVTKKGVRYVDILECATIEAQKMLENKDYTPVHMNMDDHNRLMEVLKEV